MRRGDGRAQRRRIRAHAFAHRNRRARRAALVAMITAAILDAVERTHAVSLFPQVLAAYHPFYQNAPLMPLVHWDAP